MIEIKKGISTLNIFLASLLGLIIITLIISLDKGFDFTDEGGFLLSYENTELYRGGVYNYHIIIDKLTGWLDPGIIAYRWMTILLIFISSIFLSFGFYKWIKSLGLKNNIFQNLFFLFCFISIGNFLFCFPGLRTVYNNTLTNFILQVCTGLILYLFSQKPGLFYKRRKSLLILILIGSLCAFSFFIKFPAGVLQLGSYSFFLLIYLKDQKISRRIFALGIFFLGFIIGLQLYFVLFQNVSEWYINFKHEYNMLSDHSTGMLLKSYLFEVFTLIKFVLRNFSWLLIFPGFILLNKYFQLNINPKKLRPLGIAILCGSFLILLYQIYYFKFYRSALASTVWINTYFYLIIIVLQTSLLLAFIPSKVSLVKQNFGLYLKRISVIFLLLITPFIGAFGTANPLFMNSLIHAATWFGLIVFLSAYLIRYLDRKIIISAFILLPAFITTSQIVDGNLFSPYYSIFNLNKADYFQQNETVDDLPLLDGIQVDEKTAVFLNEMDNLLEENNYKKGSPILGFHIPGVVYLFEGVSPGVPYYFNKDRDVNAIKSFELNGNLPVIMVTKENPINIDLLETMQNKGINFPENYLLKGEVYFPNTDSFLKVYFPRNY